MPPNNDDIRKPADEVVETSLQTKEQVGMGRLGDMSNRAVGENKIEGNDGVEGKTMLISLEGVPYR